MLLKTGERDLTLEDTLGELENRFVRLRRKIVRCESLTFPERVDLTLFVVAMHTRTISMGDRWTAFQKQTLEVVKGAELAVGCEPILSREIEDYIPDAHQQFVVTNLNVQTPLLLALKHTILVTDDEVGFITSDDPVVWFDPKAYQRPPAQRQPAIMWPSLEITLPITPHHMLFISHRDLPAYGELKPGTIDHLNSRTRGHCTAEFVASTGIGNSRWYDQGIMPADAWENTPAGKAALARY